MRVGGAGAGAGDGRGLGGEIQEHVQNPRQEMGIIPGHLVVTINHGHSKIRPSELVLMFNSPSEPMVFINMRRGGETDMERDVGCDISVYLIFVRLM